MEISFYWLVMIISCLKCDLCTFFRKSERHVYRWVHQTVVIPTLKCSVAPCTFQKYVICQNRLLITQVYWPPAVYNPITRLKQKPRSLSRLQMIKKHNAISIFFLLSSHRKGEGQNQRDYMVQQLLLLWIYRCTGCTKTYFCLLLLDFCQFSSYWPLHLKLGFRIIAPPQA